MATPAPAPPAPPAPAGRPVMVKCAICQLEHKRHLSYPHKGLHYCPAHSLDAMYAAAGLIRFARVKI